MTDWRRTAARGAYSALMTLLEPLDLLRLGWRGRAEPLYRHAIGERFGRYASAPSTGWIWVHAVSLGETRAAAALIDALRARRPQLRLLLSHGTATGREAGAALVGPVDEQVWLPHDTPAATARFFRHFRPAIGVLMETEVWPNLLLAAEAAGVPMVLANARLSARSLAQGRRFGAVLRPAMAGLSRVLAQTAADAERLRQAGARGVVVAGNLKFDMAPDPALRARGRDWARVVDRPMVLAAVFREGEEALLLAAWRGVAAPRPLLVIVPRHPQRFDEVAAMVTTSGLTLARRSGWNGSPPPEAPAADVWLGDSIGEMPLYYAAARVALLGGSFAPLGGQNLIEAAACACPVVMGPHTFNFAEAADLALGAGAAVRVDDMAGGVHEALALLEPQRRARCAERALAFAAEHRGAAARMAEAVDALWSSPAVAVADQPRRRAAGGSSAT